MITAICNQKGGVGKTSLTMGLTQALAALGQRVLVVDLDPQANATVTLGIEPSGDDFTMFDVMAASRDNLPEAVSRALVEAGPGWSGVHALPSERGLAERSLDGSAGRESRLKRALALVSGAYDYVLIDCPPSLDLLTINALTAANKALIVTEPRDFSLLGVQEMLATIINVRDNYNESLTLAGIVVNKWIPGRTNRADSLADARQAFGDVVLDTMVPEREAIAKAAGQHLPLPATPQNADIIGAYTTIATYLNGK